MVQTVEWCCDSRHTSIFLFLFFFSGTILTGSWRGGCWCCCWCCMASLSFFSALLSVWPLHVLLVLVCWKVRTAYYLPPFCFILGCRWASSLFLLILHTFDCYDCCSPFKGHTVSVNIATCLQSCFILPLYFFTAALFTATRRCRRCHSAVFALIFLLSFLCNVWCWAEKKRNCNRKVISSAVFKRNT